jgi:AICAR transformylase/IMP cyclohydrolase PurH
MSSYGDFAALSDECDEATAAYLAREVSDGVIAPSYSEKALEILKKKKKGNYLVLQMDPDYEPAELEQKEVFGVTFEQRRNNFPINRELFLQNIPTKNKKIFRAKTIELDYADFNRKAEQLIAIANTGDKRATVAEMKTVVPDFVSLNSVYHELDKSSSTK